MSQAGSWIKNEAHEAKDAGKELVHYAKTHDHKKSVKNAFQWKYWKYWLAAILIIVVVALLAIFRDRIVTLFEPHKKAIVDTPASWLIPVAVLILISFPPLTGHEIVLLVVGLIWGLWVGFAIACAGTFLGELACYYAFKYWFTAKAKKIEEKSIFYACLARLMRDGGLPIIIVVRFSAIPGHVVTAIQSTVGMSVWVYCVAVVISLPKQLAIVYLGVEFGVSKAAGSSASEIRKQRVVSLSVFFATCLATLLAAYIVYMRARRVYPDIVREAEERKNVTARTEDPESGMLGTTLTQDSYDYGPPNDGYPAVDPFDPPDNNYAMTHRPYPSSSDDHATSSDGHGYGQRDPRRDQHRVQRANLPLAEQGIEQGSMSQVDLLPYPGEGPHGQSGKQEEYRPMRYESM